MIIIIKNNTNKQTNNNSTNNNNNHTDNINIYSGRGHHQSARNLAELAFLKMMAASQESWSMLDRH